MFTPKASSEQKWVKKTQERETGDAGKSEYDFLGQKLHFHSEIIGARFD